MKHNKHGRKRPSGHLDGIMPSSGRLGEYEKNPPADDSDSPPLGTSQRRGDGFHPFRSSGLSVGTPIRSAEVDERRKLTDEPIILDEESTPQPKKRFKRLSRPSFRQFIKRAGIALAAILIIGAAYFGIKFYITERHVLRGGGRAPALAENIDINQLRREGDGRVNILLLGIGGPGHDGPDLTDTILIASIDPINHSTGLLSIPRDLCVSLPCGPNQKINAVYALAKENSHAKKLDGRIRDGLNALDKTLGPIIGIPIHYHAIIDFGAFKQSVNAVGGVDVTVPQTLYDPTIAWENHYNPVIAVKGRQHMDGQKALLYAKSRETTSDFSRAMRQRLILVALKQKIFTIGTFSNPIKISNLLSSLGTNVYTDFSLSDIHRLYQIMSQIPSGNIKSLDLVTPPHDLLTTGTYDGVTSIVRPKAGLFIYKQIRYYVYNALRDGLIAKENAAIAVYNATNQPGKAATYQYILKSFGYRVPTAANAPNATNPVNTILVDLSKGKDRFTRHYLELRFGVTAKNSLPAQFSIAPPQGTDFVIILGQDATASR